MYIYLTLKGKENVILKKGNNSFRRTINSLLNVDMCKPMIKSILLHDVMIDEMEQLI